MEVTPMTIKKEIVESDEEKNVIEAAFLVGTNENKLKTLSERMEGKSSDSPPVARENVGGSTPLTKERGQVVKIKQEALSVLKNSHLHIWTSLEQPQSVNYVKS